MPYVIFLIVVFIWTSSFILMKRSLDAFGPLSVGGWRVLGGGVVMMIFWLLSRRKWPFTRAHLPHLIVIAVINYIVPFVIQPYIIRLYDSAFMGMMIAFVPILTVVVSVPLLRSYPTRRQFAGVLGGLACMGLLLADSLSHDVKVSHFLVALIVPFTYAFSNTYVKSRLPTVPPLALAAVCLTAGGLALIPAGLITEPVVVDDTFPMALTSLILLAVFCTGVAAHLFFKLIQDHGPLFAGMVAYLIPLGAIGWGALDGEPVTALQIVAIIGVFLMVAIVQIGTTKPTPAVPH